MNFYRSDHQRHSIAVKYDEWEYSSKRVLPKDLSVGAADCLSFPDIFGSQQTSQYVDFMVVIVRSHFVCIRSH